MDHCTVALRIESSKTAPSIIMTVSSVRHVVTVAASPSTRASSTRYLSDPRDDAVIPDAARTDIRSTNSVCMLEPTTAKSSTGHVPGRRPHSRRIVINRSNADTTSSVRTDRGSVVVVATTTGGSTPRTTSTIGSPVIAPVDPPHATKPTTVHHHFTRIDFLPNVG